MELDAVDLELAQKAARATVVSARAENVRALQDEERQRALLQKKAVSRQEYESAKAQADSTTANLHAAEASARQADNQVQYAVLRADADGIIMDVMADVGQVVAAGQTVASLAQNDTREAVVYLPETMTSYAKDAKEAFLYSDPAKRFKVSLRELSATADPVTRTYQGRYTLEGDGQSAPLGSTVTVSFTAPHDGNANTYRVPIGALYDNGNGSSVWIIDAATSTVHPKPVTVIDLGEEFASVTGDLSSGEQVVALGVHLLKDNEKIRIENVNIADGR
jgi:RND family efflux transporter MFP subunit